MAAGVPGRWPQVGDYLRDQVGHDFPVLARLRHKRAIKSIASMLRDKLDPDTTVIGLDQKVLAGIVFAEVVDDPALATTFEHWPGGMDRTPATSTLRPTSLTPAPSR